MERIVDLSLVSKAYTTDAIGQQVATSETTRTVICTLNGITRQEWAMAAQTGLNPECMAYLRDSADYAGEELAEIGGVRYGIYRVFPTNDGGIELYLRRNVGVNQ